MLGNEERQRGGGAVAGDEEAILVHVGRLGQQIIECCLGVGEARPSVAELTGAIEHHRVGCALWNVAPTVRHHLELEVAMTPSDGGVRSLLTETKQADLSGKGASDDEIQRAETQLGVRFPDSYRMFLKEHGWGHFGSLGLIAGLGSDIPAEWKPGVDIIQITTQERFCDARSTNG